MKPKPFSVFTQLALMDRRKLDAVFHEAHQKVFETFDCLSCGNCCKSIPPVIREADVRRISAHLRMKAVEFCDRYISYDEDKDMVMNQSPCPFLEPDNSCRIYDHRPLACSEYPHTDRVRMYQILDLTKKNAVVCPAVRDILTLVEKAIPARPIKKA